jgi:hypothetical protein
MKYAHDHTDWWSAICAHSSIASASIENDLEKDDDGVDPTTNIPLPCRLKSVCKF